MRQDGCTCGVSTAPPDGSHLPGCPVVPMVRPEPAPSPQDLARATVIAAVQRYHAAVHQGSFASCPEAICYAGHPLVLP